MRDRGREREREGEGERGECRSNSLEILSYQTIFALQLDSGKKLRVNLSKGLPTRFSLFLPTQIQAYYYFWPTPLLTSSPPFFRGLGSNYGRGLNLNIYSSNSRGRSAGQVTLETTPSKVAELQIGNV